MTNKRVPRDAAFWNTYYDVQREQDLSLVKMRCRKEGHPQTGSSMDSMHCECGLNPVQAAIDLGYTVHIAGDGTTTVTT